MSATSGPTDDARRADGQQAMLASQRAKQNREGQGPSEAANRGRFAQFFPLGYKEGFNQWWANISPAAAEHNVLSFIPYLQKPPTHTHTGSAPVSKSNSSMTVDTDASKDAAPVQSTTFDDPYGPRAWHSNLVKLSGKDRYLNEFSVERVGEEIEENLVMLHGYGAGLGFFYRNFEGLSRVKGWKIYALDMLGMGRSSRPPFRIHAKDQQGKITEAESWFVDSLEEWRVVKKIDKFTLLGHSMGGYMAVAYALKYPGHLKKLILASPVGIPEDPYAVAADMPEPVESTLVNEFTQDQETDIVNKSASTKPGDNNNFLNARSKSEPKKSSDSQPGTATPPRRPINKWITYLWDANISPFSLVRWGGPLGPRLTSGWTTRRFSHLPASEADALHHYSYSLFRQRGSGEYVLAYILAPGAFARSPLIRRIGGVGRQPLPSPSVTDSATATAADATKTQMKELGIPVVMMYGENDWMDIGGGYAAEQKLKEEKEKATKGMSKEEKALDEGSAKVLIVKKSGHHLYLEGYEEFNEMMREEMTETSRKEKIKKAKQGTQQL